MITYVMTLEALTKYGVARPPAPSPIARSFSVYPLLFPLFLFFFSFLFFFFFFPSDSDKKLTVQCIPNTGLSKADQTQGNSLIQSPAIPAVQRLPKPSHGRNPEKNSDRDIDNGDRSRYLVCRQAYPQQLPAPHSDVVIATSALR